MSTEVNITLPQLGALYEVSRKINSQLDLKKLLDEIMDLAVDLLDAEKGLIFFRDDETGELQVEVARQIKGKTLEDVVALSSSIIKKVEKEGKPVLLERVPDLAGKDISKSMVRHRLKSVICVPLRSKDKFVGIIYLDTTDEEHFFSERDLTFLESFANLAGIAIDNAMSYQAIQDLNANLEIKVEERTRELKEAHAQLLHSEKMASLGMLVAGVAHEINTPMGSITSNNDTFKRGFQRLRKFLAEGSREGGRKEILKRLEILDNLCDLNGVACDRITHIVRSLRNFARLDEGEIKTVDIHEGIDSTLSLIDHLTRDRITFDKQYGSIPQLTCYANQLNQIFMNILVNACQAIEEEGVVGIKTWSEDETIFVAISDTGVGIPEKDLSKIFDPGFTTKGVGVGTGLGLSISYKIIEKHGGKIEVASEVGKGTVFTLHLPLNYLKNK